MRFVAGVADPRNARFRRLGQVDIETARPTNDSEARQCHGRSRLQELRPQQGRLYFPGRIQRDRAELSLHRLVRRPRCRQVSLSSIYIHVTQLSILLHLTLRKLS